MDAKESLEALIKKNTIFQHDRSSASRRQALKDGQYPAAVVLACSDSRVSPELIFRAEPGELFVIRTAGNVLDWTAIGSIEYAVGRLHTPLLLILGHENCGAVAAAMDAVAKAEAGAGGAARAECSCTEGL